MWWIRFWFKSATDREVSESRDLPPTNILYSTGMRNFELRQLQVKDIDSQSKLIHIQRGKGGRDRYVPLSPKLRETLREYWRWMKPKTWLFPGTLHNCP